MENEITIVLAGQEPFIVPAEDLAKWAESPYFMAALPAAEEAADAAAGICAEDFILAVAAAAAAKPRTPAELDSYVAIAKTMAKDMGIDLSLADDERVLARLAELVG